jgi:hypothetical protein
MSAHPVCLSWLAVRRPSLSHSLGTCGAPGVIAPGRGELEWFPVSNPALCRVVDMREDGRSMRLFRGPRRTYSLPLGSPIWGFTAHVGGRAPSRVHTWVSPIFSLGCFSALCLHVSHARPGLFCIVLSSQLCCLRVVCINMNEGAPPQNLLNVADRLAQRARDASCFEQTDHQEQKVSTSPCRTNLLAHSHPR